jgi:tRNA-specific 2-thiouridylase
VPLRDVNWLSPVPAAALRCCVRLRARDVPRPASIHAADGRTVVELDEPALPAPGQACVFYAGDRVLGGGIIDRCRDGSDPTSRVIG